MYQTQQASLLRQILWRNNLGSLISWYQYICHITKKSCFSIFISFLDFWQQKTLIWNGHFYAHNSKKKKKLLKKLDFLRLGCEYSAGEQCRDSRGKLWCCKSFRHFWNWGKSSGQNLFLFHQRLKITGHLYFFYQFIW